VFLLKVVVLPKKGGGRKSDGRAIVQTAHNPRTFARSFLGAF
jgi:hypothetical protein